MGQEPGLNFAMLDAYNSLEERVTSLKDGKVTTAHNVWDGKIGKYLPGGTMITTRRDIGCITDNRQMHSATRTCLTNTPRDAKPF